MTPCERATCRDEDCDWRVAGVPWEISSDIREHMQDTGHPVGIMKGDPESDFERSGEVGV